MIRTYRLYHDGLPVQSWSHSYEASALRQLARETEPGVWELQLVSLNPRTFEETQCNVARRTIEPDPVKTTVEFLITKDGAEAYYNNIYDARRAWRAAILLPGDHAIYRCRDRIPEARLSYAFVVVDEDWL